MAISRAQTSKQLTGGKRMRKAKRKSKIRKVLKEHKEGKLRSGSKKGPKVKSRKQAIAIALSESEKRKA
tara:strand:- start:10896 stop:11102 length:207 start_codon:yes stop_codon:yes gene_type:complete